MNEKKALRAIAKRKRDLDREFKTNFKKVRTKIRRIPKLNRLDKKVLIADLAEVNGDLMDVLLVGDKFNGIDDYFNIINAYLRSEMDCFDYNGIVLVYMPSKMKELMRVITNQHNIIDQKNKLRKIIGLNEIN